MVKIMGKAGEKVKIGNIHRIVLNAEYRSKAARDRNRTGWAIRGQSVAINSCAKTYKNMNLIVVISGMNELAYRNG